MATHLTTAIYQRINEAFDAAVEAAGGACERRYRVAGHPIRVRAAGAAASDWLDDSLHHLSSDGDPEPAALTVLAWDARAGGAFPVEPSTWVRAAWQRRPWFLEFDPAADGEGPARWRRVSGLVDRTTAVYWMSDRDDLPGFEHGTPLLTALQRWLAERHIRVVHGGAVATQGGAALIGGDNGAGKSTTAIACYEAGVHFLADDYVAVELDPPRVHSLFSSAKLDWDHPAGVGATLQPINRREDGDEKALYLLRDRVASVATIRAIIAPRVSPSGPTTLAPMTAGRALMSLAPSSILQLAGDAGDRLAALRSLCEQVPAFELVLGTDIKAATAMVTDVLMS